MKINNIWISNDKNLEEYLENELNSLDEEECVNLNNDRECDEFILNLVKLYYSDDKIKSFVYKRKDTKSLIIKEYNINFKTERPSITISLSLNEVY